MFSHKWRGFTFLLSTFQIVGVSILRAGETMEQALCEVYKDITIGKILIQTNLDTGEPEVYHTFLHHPIVCLYKQRTKLPLFH